MADRVMMWHIPSPGAPTPVFYADRDYEAVALRMYAETAPGGDMVVDILDDSVSIMNANTRKTVTFKNTDGEIEHRTEVGTFQVNEEITGGTSGATARVKALKTGGLVIRDASATAFTVDETITGGTSSATSVVCAYVKARNEWTPGTIAGQSHAVLPKGKNANESAQDFKQSVEIAEGSWVSLSVLDAAGAQKVTVQLELNALAESVEQRRWAE